MKKSLSTLSRRKSKNGSKKVVEEIPLTTEEREFREHCTFKPKILSKSRNRGDEDRTKKCNAKSYGERDTWLVSASRGSNNHTPRAYEQAITRMRQARAKQVEAKHLLDVHSTLRSGHRVSPSKDLPEGHRDASAAERAFPFPPKQDMNIGTSEVVKQLGYRKQTDDCCDTRGQTHVQQFFIILLRFK